MHWSSTSSGNEPKYENVQHLKFIFLAPFKIYFIFWRFVFKYSRSYDARDIVFLYESHEAHWYIKFSSYRIVCCKIFLIDTDSEMKEIESHEKFDRSHRFTKWKLIQLSLHIRFSIKSSVYKWISVSCSKRSAKLRRSYWFNLTWISWKYFEKNYIGDVSVLSWSSN